MQYTEYIATETARREREQQLIKKYNQTQPPINEAEKSITTGEALSIVAGLLLVAIIVLASLILGA